MVPKLTRRQQEQEKNDLKYGNQEQLEKEIERDAILMLQHKKKETIDGFFNYFEFLKTEYPSKVYF
jgi:hypothetical protein